IAFRADGKTALVAMSRNNSIGVVDAASRKLDREVPVGMAPFAVAISAKRGRVFVSNRGGRRPKEGDTTAPSSGSEIVTNSKTGSSVTGTLSVMRLDTLEVEKEIEVGLAPSLMALSPDESALAVANGHSDSVMIVDTDALSRQDVRIPTWPETV